MHTLKLTFFGLNYNTTPNPRCSAEKHESMHFSGVCVEEPGIYERDCLELCKKNTIKVIKANTQKLSTRIKVTNLLRILLFLFWH